METFGIFFLFPLAGCVMYTGNKWNRWYKYFKRGNASKEDFKEAVKWSGISLAIAVVTYPFLLIFGK